MHDIAWAQHRSGILSGLLLSAFLSGCLSESTESEPAALDPGDQTVLTGSVGDGPIVGATLTIATLNGGTIIAYWNRGPAAQVSEDYD